MKKAYIMVVMFATLSLSTFSACGDTSTAPPPTVLNPDEDNSDGSDGGEGDETSEMTRIYDIVKKNQLAYIRSLQISSGAIKDNEQSNSRICPYFSNFAVMALLKNPVMENVEVVKKYITWYLNKLNRTNINPHTGQPEIIGSVYDYYGDTETTHGTYDSVDSYAATFLEIVMELAKLSEENKNWLQEKKDDISLVASAMINTIDTESFSIPTDFTSDDNDYLSIAKLDYPVKYLMDNCEVNMGLKAALWLKDNGLIDNAVDFSTFLAQNTKKENFCIRSIRPNSTRPRVLLFRRLISSLGKKLSILPRLINRRLKPGVALRALLPRSPLLALRSLPVAISISSRSR